MVAVAISTCKPADRQKEQQQQQPRWQMYSKQQQQMLIGHVIITFYDMP
jgi:hypothetical protein